MDGVRSRYDILTFPLSAGTCLPSPLGLTTLPVGGFLLLRESEGQNATVS